MRLIDADALMETIKSNDYMLVDICNTKDFGMYTIGIQQVVDEQPTIEPPVVQWISAEDRLPEVGTPVMVRHIYSAGEFGGVTIGRLFQPSDNRRNPYWTFISYRYDGDSIYSEATDFICPGSEYVTHWMPLPEPPTVNP